MDQRADDIKQGIEQTKQEMEGTRAAMTEKLEQLEERVRETVEGAASTVEGIVGNVKETVDSTVETVKQTVDGAKSSMENMVGNVKGTVEGTVETVRRTFDLSYQVDRSPWLMFGGSVLVGYFLGSLGSTNQSSLSSSEAYQTNGAPQTFAPFYKATHENVSTRSDMSSHSQPQPRSGWSSLLNQFPEETAALKGALVAALVNVVHDMVQESIPAAAPYVKKIFNISDSHSAGSSSTGQQTKPTQQPWTSGA